jgi:hypothetical protein
VFRLLRNPVPLRSQACCVWVVIVKIECCNFSVAVSMPACNCQERLWVVARVLAARRPKDIPKWLKSLIASYHVNPIADLEPAGHRQDFIGCQVERMKYQTERLIFYKFRMSLRGALNEQKYPTSSAVFVLEERNETRCHAPTGSQFAQNRVPQPLQRRRAPPELP